ncbi:DUF423 domain-containing protein [Geminicoccaceae bacterium 1502E]|nr:DUF423 domain-containing protein [Geminicoccaceae bacterium 1502E]
MQERHLQAAALVLGLLGVAAGAFGAHGLEARPAELFATASSYQVWHALAILACSALRLGRPAQGAFLAGVLVFSGSLYLLALGAPRPLGMITPLGGLFLMAGWALALRELLVARR